VNDRLSEIRGAVEGFSLRARILNSDYLPLDTKEILKAMECSNRIMSEQEIKLWIHKYSPCLFWKQDYYILKERDPQLYPDEFLYLITNARDKLKHVRVNIIID
jgi:hypothetical protein